MTKIEKLIAAGQHYIPGFDEICFAAEKAFNVVIKGALDIKESAKSIIVKIGSIVLRLTGDCREDHSAESLRKEVFGMSEKDAIATFEGCGFVALAGR